MLPIPENEWSDAVVLASWLEMSVLAEEGGLVLRGAALEALRDSQLFSDASALRGDDRDSATEGSAASTLAAAWAELESRRTKLGNGWPYDLTEDRIERAPGKRGMEATAAYGTMLLLEAAGSKWYPMLRVAPGDRVRAWFEDVVAASIKGLIGGCCSRFGAPFAAGWPKGFVARVRYLAGLFGILSRDSEVAGATTPQQKDDTLDLVARWRIGHEEPGSPYLLFQCATGADWNTAKPGEPSMDLWRTYVAWNGPTFKALAIPFTLRTKQMERAWLRHGSAIILDRIRLACGCPDERLDDPLRQKLAGWCRSKFSLIARGFGASAPTKRERKLLGGTTRRTARPVRRGGPRRGRCSHNSRA